MTIDRTPESGSRTDVPGDDEDGPYRLCDIDGDVVGRIVGRTDGFLVVERDNGFLGLGGKEALYVPCDAVVREHGTDCYLSIDADRLASMPWDGKVT
jgi:hypothetical protein